MLDPIEEPTEADATDADSVGGRQTVDDWPLEHNLHVELAAADADYAAGNTISGEQLRRRYGLT